MRKEKRQIHKGNMKLTFLKRILDLRASRIEASVSSATDIPLSLLCCEFRAWDAPTNLSCSRICEMIRLAFDVFAESSKNLSR